MICPLTAELDVTPICQGCYSCFHVPLASASQVPAEGSGSGRQRGCLTGAIASRVAGKTLGAAGLECFGQGSTLQQLWFILLIIWCWEHLICNSGKLPLPVLKGAPGSFTMYMYMYIYIYIGDHHNSFWDSPFANQQMAGFLDMP